ncbi:DUF4132 domain-containing protein [Actinoplanes missouriensis]|uniref:DUF4132 domain-containing protein n=1 Tax=Actinoplanes missouriensis TaxID=1866 RepID=UPI0033C49254
MATREPELICPDTTEMAWADGERELWASRAEALDHGREQPDWALAATSADKLANLTPQQVSWLFVKGPDASARALMAQPSLLRNRQRIDLHRVAIARFERDAFALAHHEAGANADRLGLLMLPFRGPEAATLIAGWLRNLGSSRLWARLWLERHPESAARALIPAAAGRPGRARQNAGDALRHLAAIGCEPIIRKTAIGYGRSTPGLIDQLLNPPPAGAPKPPEWAVPDQLPEILLAGGGIMPDGDVTALIEALSLSRLADPPEPAPGDPAPDGAGLPLIVESSAARQPLVAPPVPAAQMLIARADRRSAAAFGRALLDAWLAADMPAAHAWVVPAQAHLGDDATFDRLAPLVRSWPPKGRYARAIDGFAVLATAGTDTALRHLLSIEVNMSGGPTNERAVDYLTQASARRGLSVTQLADRLTVTHGLDTGVTLDYGSRVFPVVTDDHLAVHVTGPDGRLLARPPKPGVKDTDPDAYQHFLRFKKELRVTVSAQIARFQREMLAHLLRPARDLPGVLLPHPILGPIARRLLWGEYDADHRLVRALRIAEDGSLADVNDKTAAVGGDAPLGIVHPAEVGADLGEWAQIFADYEILQPFPQVNRPAVTLTAEQRAATSLAGFGPVAPDGIAEMVAGRWRGNGYYSPAHLHTQLTRELPGELTLLVELTPGVPMSTYTAPAGEQRITEIWLDHSWSDHWQLARRIPFGAADPAALSEVLVELYALS